MSSSPKASPPRGFTLLEVVIALAVFSIGLLAVSSMAGTAMKSNYLGNNTVMAVNLTQSLLDEIRVMDRTDLEGTTEFDPVHYTGNLIFSRTATVDINANPRYSCVSVKTAWGPGNRHQVTLTTIMAD